MPRVSTVSIITSALSMDTDGQEADKKNYFPINSSRSLGLCLHLNLAEGSFLSSVILAGFQDLIQQPCNSL